MAGEWKRVTIGEVAERVAMGPFGSSIKVSTFVEKGIPVISGQHLRGSRLEDNEFNFVSEEHADALKNANVFRGDVVFTHAGNIGQCAYIPDTSKYSRYVLSQRQFYMRCDKSKVLPEFITCFFKSAEGRHVLLANASQTGVPSIARPVTYVRTIEIPLPPLAEQKAIASVLGALDDKIELNRRMNATLEAMARALFQSWFIDFDPVRANLDRNQPSTRPVGHPSPTGRRDGDEGASGMDFDPVRAKLDGNQPEGMDAEAAALFPDSFTDSDFGHIPKGWVVMPVGDVVATVGGATPSTTEPKYWENGTHHWTTPKDFSSLQAPILLDTSRKITDAGLAKISSGLLPAGTVLLSSRAPIGYLAIATIPVAINQGFIAMKCNARASNYFMLNWCQANMPEIHSRATGTTFAEISKKDFRPIPVILPPKEIMDAFTKEAAPLYDRIISNLKESRTLATLRDTLLPKLLSGELSVAALDESVSLV